MFLSTEDQASIMFLLPVERNLKSVRLSCCYECLVNNKSTGSEVERRSNTDSSNTIFKVEFFPTEEKEVKYTV